MKLKRTTAVVQVSRMVAFATALILLVAGCTTARRGSANPRLSDEQALVLAVGLANQECEARFSRTPFDKATSNIRFANGRWSWGGLDLAGQEGLSAAVSFDEFGGDRVVEVYLSADGLTPIIPRDSTPQ
jgi:hypothetical protein